MKSKFLPVAMLTLGLFGASGAYAAPTLPITVSASVTGTCQINSMTGTATFGALDQTSTSDASFTGAPSVSFWCTKGTAVGTISFDNGGNYLGGTRRMKGGVGNADFIPYTITGTPSATSGAGKTSPLTLTITGTVLNADYVNVSAGSYADSVILTITP